MVYNCEYENNNKTLSEGDVINIRTEAYERKDISVGPFSYIFTISIELDPF